MSFRLFSVILASSVVLSCAPAPPPQSGSSQAPAAEQRSTNQAITISEPGLPASMSPESAASFNDIYATIFDSALWLDNKYDIVPAAVEKWTQTTPTTWRFTIRPDLVFSNGDKATAADLAFTAQLMLDTKTPALTNFGSLAEVKLVDDRNVDFVTKTKDASVLSAMSSIKVMPKAYYTSVGKAGFAAKPVGSGPYELADFRAGDQVVVKKRAAEHPFRKVVLTQLTFRSITESGQMVNGFRTKDLDVVIGSLNIDRLNELKKADGVVYPRNATYQQVQFPSAEAQARQTPLTDRRVRLALNYAVDKATIVRAVYGEYGQPIGQLAAPNSPSWDPTVQPIPYDPAMAKRLLAEAGYPNGFTLPAGIDFSPTFGDANVVLAVQGYLKDVGVIAQINTLESGVFIDKFYVRNGQTRGDLFINTGTDSNGFASALYGYYSCDRPPANISWCNPKFDQLMQQANAEADYQTRSTLLRQAISVFREDVTQLFLFVIPTFEVLQPNVRGFVGPQNLVFNYDLVYRVD